MSLKMLYISHYTLRFNNKKELCLKLKNKSNSSNRSLPIFLKKSRKTHKQNPFYTLRAMMVMNLTCFHLLFGKPIKMVKQCSISDSEFFIIRNETELFPKKNETEIANTSLRTLNYHHLASHI